jgi:acylphosphatase
MPARRITVTGRVQGVFFRAHAKEKAEEVGLTGWVRNTDDSVEIYAEGTSEALDVLERWCHRGPAGAEVASVQSEEVSPEGLREFSIRYGEP